MNLKVSQLSALIILRVVVGWHFAYEGLAKILQPNWSASFYLNDSFGYFSEFFKSLTSNQAILDIVNVCNMYGLLLIGVALITGTFTKIASWGGIAMLTLYTMSHPSLIGVNYLQPVEGSYLLIDKNIIEIAALFVIWMIPSSTRIGLDRFLQNYCGKLI